MTEGQPIKRKLPDQIEAKKARTLIHISGDGMGLVSVSISANHVHEDYPGCKRDYIARQEEIAAEIVRRWNAHTPLVEAARGLIATRPVFRVKPMGGEGSAARHQQQDEIAAEDAVRAAIAAATGESRT